MMSKGSLYFKFKALYIKSASWEYWPIWLVYFPLSFYYVYLSIKARSFFFFSAANPSIETGGMFFESKWSIFQLIPQEYFPPTILINTDNDTYQISEKMRAANISFPVIAKPDRGERGWCVKKINSVSELINYKQSVNIPFLIQTYINLPVELSIFYYRNPQSKNGSVTSVTFKKLLAVTGNGRSTIEELIKKDNRAFLQFNRLKKENEINFDVILKDGEEKLLVPYGNHVLGTTFLNYNHIIDPELNAAIDQISKRIPGFYYGRYDLRCASIEELKKGINISILELNGASAEPAHIYNPGFSFFKAQLVLIRHYKMLYQAAIANKKKGAVFMSYRSFWNTRNLEKVLKQKINVL